MCGATIKIDGGLLINLTLTDPVLDDAGSLYVFGLGSVYCKLNNPLMFAEKIGSIDLVLLSQHQHHGKFYRAGKTFI